MIAVFDAVALLMRPKSGRSVGVTAVFPDGVVDVRCDAEVVVSIEGGSVVRRATLSRGALDFPVPDHKGACTLVARASGLDPAFLRLGGEFEDFRRAVDGDYEAAKAAADSPDSQPIAWTRYALHRAVALSRDLGVDEERRRNWALRKCLLPDTPNTLERWYEPYFQTRPTETFSMPPDDPKIYASLKNPPLPPKTDYDEDWRSQLRFTPARGRVNDPNGLSYRKGVWHLFFQHNPYGREEANWQWSHAVSSDLVHWRELGVAIAPDDNALIYSGSGVFDEDNCAGFGKAAHVLFYTAADSMQTNYCQSIAWSTNGVDYVKWAGNPVLPHVNGRNRDPRVFFHRPTNRWVMFLYVTERLRHGFNVYTSDDLKRWTFASRIVGGYDERQKNPYGEKYLAECAEVVELQVEGEDETKWAIWGATGDYAIGSFDGVDFRPEVERVRPIDPAAGDAYYATQAFTGADGRKPVIFWCFRNDTPESAPCTRSMSIPMELGLVRTAAGLRVTYRPVAELAALRSGPATPLEAFEGELAECVLACRPAADARLTFDLRGTQATYDGGTQTLAVGEVVSKWPLDADGRLTLHVFVDRTGLEIFSADGLKLLPCRDVWPDRRNRHCTATVRGRIRDADFRIYPLKSIWENERK
ncbi:MAG: glycoside hydrolase family 32 protein [Kiritimatiellia bacterium]|jgi:fructan beta-fructosidase